MFKDMTDQGLDEAIKSLQALLYVAGETGHNVFRIARDLDIAVNVKRSRIRKGTWTR